MKVQHTIGIIPINSQPMDFEFPWPDCLVPINKNYLAIERAVVECAYAGCNSIWLICPQKFLPLIRYRLADIVQDPIYLDRWRESSYLPIPIYYLSVHPKDKNKRDSTMWNMLYGCSTARYAAGVISRKVIPTRYYVCFPNSVYDPKILRPHRLEIAKSKRFLVSYNGKTALDGEQMGFTITNQDVKFLIKEFRTQATGYRDVSSPKIDGKWATKSLPIEERWSGRFSTIKDIIGSLPPIDKETSIVNLDWFYSIDTFDGLCDYLGSENRKVLERPEKILVKSKVRGIANENLEPNSNSVPA
jgi:hypothetical protein